MTCSAVRSAQGDSEARAGDESKSLCVHESRKVQGNPAGAASPLRAKIRVRAQCC